MIEVGEWCRLNIILRVPERQSCYLYELGMLPWRHGTFPTSKPLGIIPVERFRKVTKGGEQILHLNFLPNFHNQRMDAVAALQTPVANSAYWMPSDLDELTGEDPTPETTPESDWHKQGSCGVGQGSWTTLVELVAACNSFGQVTGRNYMERPRKNYQSWRSHEGREQVIWWNILLWCMLNTKIS